MRALFLLPAALLFAIPAWAQQSTVIWNNGGDSTVVQMGTLPTMPTQGYQTLPQAPTTGTIYYYDYDYYDAYHHRHRGRAQRRHRDNDKPPAQKPAELRQAPGNGSPIDIPGWCQITFGPGATTRSSQTDTHSWRCVVGMKAYAVDFNSACRRQYGSDAYAGSNSATDANGIQCFGGN